MKKNKRMTRMLVTIAMFMLLVPMVANASNKSFSFNVTTNTNGGKQYSAVNIKDDSDPAYVKTTYSNLLSSDLFYYRVVATAAKNREACSAYRRVSKSDISEPSDSRYKISIQYYSGYAWAGAERCLEGDTDKYSVSASGMWWS